METDDFINQAGLNALAVHDLLSGVEWGISACLNRRTFTFGSLMYYWVSIMLKRAIIVWKFSALVN